LNLEPDNKTANKDYFNRQDAKSAKKGKNIKVLNIFGVCFLSLFLAALAS